MRDLGIVVVTHESGEEIGPCLDAALRTGAGVVVVDNASADNTVEEVRRRGVRLIANGVNCGFAAAVNEGVRSLDTEFVLLLNPDAVLETGIEPLRARCAAGAAGAGGKLVGADGRPQAGFVARRLPTPATLVFEALLLNRLWPRNPVNRRYRCLDLDLNRAQPVEQPPGALLLLRRDVWERLGGFDERFHPLWFEDVDFCARARRLGYSMYYEPAVVASHTGAHSVRKISVVKRQLYWYGSLLRYAAKHFRPPTVRVISLAVLVGSSLRICGDLLRGSGLRQAVVYGEAMRLAFRYLVVSGRQQARL